MMELSMVDLMLETLGTTSVTTVEWRLLRLVERVVRDGRTDWVSVDTMLDCVGRTVKSTVDLTADSDVERVVRLGKMLSLRDLSIEERLAVTELGKPERDV